MMQDNERGVCGRGDAHRPPVRLPYRYCKW